MGRLRVVGVRMLYGALALTPVTLGTAACGASDSQTGNDSGAGSSSGSNGSSGSSGSSGANGSSGSSSSGASGSSGGSSGSGGPGDGGGSCPAQTSLTRAVKISLPVTWPAQGQTTLSGSDAAYVWLLEAYPTVSGNALTGSFQTCKLQLPDVTLGALVGLVLGGTKVQIQIPPAAWASVPATPVAATQTGWNPPSPFNTNAPIDLVGLKLPSGTDPALAWPGAPSGFPSGTTYPDDDGDHNPGVTGTPLTGNGYVLPPTDGLAQHTADKVYIVSRNQFGLNGAWTGSGCTDQSGTATAMLFDNHVVGCHVSGGSDCTTGSGSQADFLDTNRTVYTAQTGSFAAKILASTAQCADAISALP
jgi:hypothetical protein